MNRLDLLSGLSGGTLPDWANSDSYIARGQSAPKAQVVDTPGGRSQAWYVKEGAKANAAKLVVVLAAVGVALFIGAKELDKRVSRE